MRKNKKDNKVNIKRVFLISLLGFFLPLIIVHILFKWNSGIKFLQATWESDAIISYIVSYFTLLGTIFLGYMTYRISKTSVDINSRLVEIENYRENISKQDRLGIIDIESIDFKYGFKKEMLLNDVFDENMDVIFIIIHGKITTKSIIRELCTVNKFFYETSNMSDFVLDACDYGIPFYNDQSKYKRSINLKDNTFEDSFIIYKEKKNLEFETLMGYIKSRGRLPFYRLELSYAYTNIYDEKREINIRVTLNDVCINRISVLSIN